MAPKWLRTTAALRRLTWATVAVVMCIFAIVLLRSIRVADGYLSADSRRNDGAASEAAHIDTPGGFDPIPEFGSTAAELQYRGASCMRELASVDARLHRICRSGN